MSCIMVGSMVAGVLVNENLFAVVFSFVCFYLLYDCFTVLWCRVGGRITSEPRVWRKFSSVFFSK